MTTVIEKIKSTQERACKFWGLKKMEFPVKCLSTSHDTYSRWMSGKNKPPGSVQTALVLIEMAINDNWELEYLIRRIKDQGGS